jgi:hypothetical protein
LFLSRKGKIVQNTGIKRMGENRKKVVLGTSGKRIVANPPFKDISQK